MSSHVARPLEDIAAALAKIKGITVNDALKFLGGKDFALSQQAKLMAGGGEATKLGRMAGGKAARNVLRLVPGLGVGLAALDAADVVTGNESLINKGMDAAGMTIGGTLGAIGGPLGIAAGASTGKFVSDGLQYLFGDKKTPEQRRMEEALAMLQGGRY